MKTLNDLREFYLKTLRPDLQILEGRRREIIKKLAFIGVPSLVILALSLAYILINELKVWYVLFPLFFLLFIFLIAYYFLTRKFIVDFKGKVIQRIVGFIDEKLRYRQDGYITVPEFKESKIFKHRIDRYKGDDLVWGKLGATVIKFSEVHAEYKTESRDSKGNKQTHWHTIFKGLFYMADFNKHIIGETVVLPDTAERLFGRLGKKLQSLNKPRGHLIHLEDPEFEKNFAVYGDDQVQARYILSTSLMKRIMDFKKKTDKDIYLSFRGTKVYIAIRFTKDLFEPKIFRTLLDFKVIQEYFEDLTLAYAIVEDLNLNTRIWGKR